MPAAYPQLSSGSSSALSNVVNLTVSSLVGDAQVNVGPTTSVSRSAPAPYTDGASALSAALALVPVGPVSLNTGLLTVNVSSDVNGASGPHSAFANAIVNNLLLVTGLTLFSADTLSSTATVSGDYGALVATGTTTLANGFLNGIVSVTSTPAPNTVLLNALGLRMVLNEQTVTGDGIGGRTLLVSGLHASFSNYLLSPLVSVTGDIMIANSQAALLAVAAVPEPATVSMFSAGLAGLLAALRRRRPATSDA